MRGLSIFVEHLESRAPSRLSALMSVPEKELEGQTNSNPRSLDDFVSWRTAPVFDDEPENDFTYKTMSWPVVSALLIAEIMSNGILSLPSTLAAVGIVPAVILIVFLGAFGLFTAKLLIDFKTNHPQVHSMGDAGFILGGPFVREILSAATIIFAVFAAGSVILSGQQALSTISDNALCTTYLIVIVSAVVFLLSLPRTLERLGVFGLFGALLIVVAALVAMISAGLYPVEGRTLRIAGGDAFYSAFSSVTSPLFAYSGHFMFFILLSEMRNPRDAIKSAWCVQVFTTTFYVVFAVVMYAYIGNSIQSPAFLSLRDNLSKTAFGVALCNFIIAGALYSHTAAKLVFVRLFRHTRHITSHTLLGWLTWIALCFLAVAVACTLAAAIPEYNHLMGVVVSLFAAWFTYGIAGFFWLHDTYHYKDGWRGVKSRPIGLTLAVFAILTGAFICIAGTYTSIKLIVNAYASGTVGGSFVC